MYIVDMWLNRTH